MFTLPLANNFFFHFELFASPVSELFVAWFTLEFINTDSGFSISFEIAV